MSIVIRCRSSSRITSPRNAFRLLAGFSRLLLAVAPLLPVVSNLLLVLLLVPRVGCALEARPPRSPRTAPTTVPQEAFGRLPVCASSCMNLLLPMCPCPAKFMSMVMFSTGGVLPVLPWLLFRRLWPGCAVDALCVAGSSPSSSSSSESPPSPWTSVSRTSPVVRACVVLGFVVLCWIVVCGLAWPYIAFNRAALCFVG
jgi:hypothetical protein